MADNTKQVAIKAKDSPEAAEVIAVPKEYYSINRGIRVEINGDQITIDIPPTIVQEVGAYHRCKVRIQFKENQGLTVLPMTPMP